MVVTVALAAMASLGVMVLAGCSDDQATTASAPSTTTAHTDPETPPSPEPEPTSTQPESEPTPTTQPPTTTQPQPTQPEPEPTPTTEPPTTTQPAPEPIAGQPCTFPAVVDQTLEALVNDCEALWAFYQSQDTKQRIDSDPATAWSETNPLHNWRGVTLADGRVAGLVLDMLISPAG